MGSNHSQGDKDPVPNFSQDNGKAIVKEKLKKLYGKQLVDDNLEKFADILSDKEKLKKVYLHTDFAEAKNLQQSIKNMSFVEPSQDSTKGPMFSSGASEAVASPTTLQMLARKSTDETELGVNSGKNHFANTEEGADDDIEPHALNTVDPFLDMKNKIRVKLIVAETSRNQLERTLKRVISPFVNMDNHGAPFGFFHIALAVGCWKIEWNSSELCIPRTVTGQASLVCADIESIADLDKLDFVRDKLAEVIVKWNTSIYYKQHGGNPDTDHNGNCQQFIDECLQILNLGSCYTQFPPPLVNYIKKLRKEGYGEMEFEFDDNFKKKFFPDTKPECLDDRGGEPNPFANIYDLYKNKGSVVFKTHDMLDRFVSYLLLVDTQFKYNHKHEFYLLKSFDRAYWMRAIKDPENEIFKPYHSEYGTEACPFSDPQNASILPFVLKK